MFLKSVMPVHSVLIKNNNLPYHWGVLLPGLHKGLQPGSRQGCPPTAMDSSRKLFRKGVKVWNVGREVVNTVAFHIIQYAAASGRPCSEPSERTFYVKCCCFLPLSLFRLCWVSFFQADSFNFASTFVSTLLCNQFPSFLHCGMLAAGIALHNELLRKAFSFLKTQAHRVISVCLQGRWLWMANQGVVWSFPGFFSPVYSPDVITVTDMCNYVDFSMQVTWVDISVFFQAFDLSLPPCTGYSFKLGFVHHTILTFLYNSSHFIFVSLNKIYVVTNYGMENFSNLMPWPVCATEVEVHLVSKRNHIWNKDLVTIQGRMHVCTFIVIMCMWKPKFFFWSMSQTFPVSWDSIQQL